ncbi:cysteine-rich KTR domain-containing protein [Clostridioides difficile]|uniref:cysteine-rich KTR domain-containing protein n=1 Tax=Clostridioides difficile TaxID=1496 RepID=UPI0003B28809|nr:cysteine-rich KTR domain-containing protein [Clostridioides difficile]EGT4548478.1 conjugal transfer protein [Clostridioides difficile]EGT4614240.1 conjugal transfer protein [Clostridioides difficile]EGT4731854.1 conjugal transfer protein [Clostridioides difficile]EGT4782206.1 conjugal transfer protein [Clostridioides difficile]EGT5363132.1 conjugal transfer protein [Clostridioides difficile]
MNIEKWILCPVCGGKTRNKIREDTVLINYPLYCPKCRQESLIVAKNMQISIVIEPNAHTYKAVNY